MAKNPPLEWTKNLTLYEVNIRQFSNGGTFEEFEKHLPRLKDLGVGIIWFMPIQPIGVKNRKGNQGSYYSIKNYKEVNSLYGTLDEFRALVKKIHSLGMYVLLDWVANHTAWDSNLTIEHPEYYSKNENGNFHTPNADWTDVIKLDFDNADLRKYMIEAMKFWVQDVDIDGFRCDMAHLVPSDFWNEARTELEKVKPLFMLAESQNRDLLEHAFDMEYTWDFFHSLNSIAASEKTVYDIDNLLENEIYNFPKDCYQMFFTSNHDENSWHGTAVERLGSALEAINTLIFTIRDMPLIYCGQEAGQWSRLSFFDKDIIKWKEDKMFPFYKTLIELKKRNPALWSGIYGGNFIRIYTSDNQRIFSFLRKKDNHEVLVLLNLSAQASQFSLQNDFNGDFTNIFTKENVFIPENANWFLNAWQYQVYER